MRYEEILQRLTELALTVERLRKGLFGLAVRFTASRSGRRTVRGEVS